MIDMYYICWFGRFDRRRGAAGEDRRRPPKAKLGLAEMSGSGANEAAEGLDTMEANDAAAAAAAATVEAGALATGARFMWHKCRMQDEQGRFGYEECGGQEAGAVVDTRVHRYARGPRFARDDQAQLDADPEFVEALAALHSGHSGPTSHQTRVNRFALLECYTLEHAPTSC